MGATNHTTNYNLSQFIGTDKPSWLNDYNGDMSSIDGAIKAASDAAGIAGTTATNAKNTADAAASTVTSLSTQINTPVTGLAAVVSDHTTDIGNLQGQAGSDALVTTAQTLTGAVNELAQQAGSDALVTTAQTLSGAINELAAGASGGSVEVTGGVGDTFTATIPALFALVDATKLTSKAVLEIVKANGDRQFFGLSDVLTTGAICFGRNSNSNTFSVITRMHVFSTPIYDMIKTETSGTTSYTQLLSESSAGAKLILHY